MLGAYTCRKVLLADAFRVIHCRSLSAVITLERHKTTTLLLLAALWNRAGHYIFVLCFFFPSSSFFLAYSQPSHIRCLPYIHTRCGRSVNLECMHEMCCTRLAENTGRKKSPFWHHRTTLSGHIFRTKACIDNRKKLLNSNTCSTCSDNIMNFGLQTAKICWRVLGTPANFNGFRVLAALLHSTVVVGVSQTLRR